jgi:hypothetical protein
MYYVTHLFWTQLMGAALEVATYQRKGNNVSILSRKFQTHMELIFKYLVVKADMQTETNLMQLHITFYRNSCKYANVTGMQSIAKDFVALTLQCLCCCNFFF